MKKKNNSLIAGGFAHSKIQLDDITVTTFADSLPIIKRDFNGQLINCISANALHNVLGIDTRLTDWIKRRINEYGFIQGVDYLLVETLSDSNLSSTKSRQQIKHEYLVTFNMAKELGMVERTEKGRLIRQYFIKCEDALHNAAPTIAKQLRQQLKSRFKVASYFKPICSALDLAKIGMLKICAPQNGGGLNVSNNELYDELLPIIYQMNSSLQAGGESVKVGPLTNTVTLTFGITGNQLVKNFINLKRTDTTPFTPMGDKPDLFDIQHNNVALFSGLNIVIRCSYLSIGLSINTLCGGILTAGGIPPLRNWLLSSIENTVVKYNQGVMTSPIGGCAGNQGFIGNKKGSTANATLLNIDNFICRKFLDVNSNPEQQCCIVQIVGTHNLFSSCLTACVLSLYSALITSSSAERDSYLAAIPDEINRLTTVFISSAVLSSSGNMLLVFPVNSESMCLQNVFAGQLQETPIFPDTSNNSTLYISFLLLLNARNLNVIAMSLVVNAQKINGYFFFCDFCLDNFILQASMTQDEKLEFSNSTHEFISSSNSCGKRIFFSCDFLFMFPVDIYSCSIAFICVYTLYSKKQKIKSLDLSTHYNLMCLHTLINSSENIATPRSALTLPRRLTTMLNGVTLWLCISLPKLTLNSYGVFSHASNLSIFWLRPLTSKKRVPCCQMPPVYSLPVFVRG